MPLVNFIPGLAANDYVMDAHLGPDGDLWIVYYNQAVGDSFRVAILAPDMTVKYNHNFDGTFGIPVSSIGRGCIVVNKNNIGVLAYQGWDGSNNATIVRTLTKTGTLGTIRSASSNILDQPNLTLWNGCEDAILAIPGGTTFRSMLFVPFLVGSEVLGTSFLVNVETAGVTFLYVYNNRQVFYDPWLDEIHMLVDCSTFRYPDLFQFNPRSILHIWGTSGQNLEIYTPPNQHADSTGSYPVLGVRAAWNKKEKAADKTLAFVWIPYTSDSVPCGSFGAIGNKRGVMLNQWTPNGGFGTPELIYDMINCTDGVVTDADVMIDGKSNQYVVCSNTDWPFYHHDNFQTIQQIYNGQGVMLRDPRQSPANFPIAVGVDCCYTNGDTVGLHHIRFARGYPHLDKSYVLFRTVYTYQGGTPTEDRWAYHIITVEPSFLPEEELLTCRSMDVPPPGGGPGFLADNHNVFVLDIRER